MPSARGPSVRPGVGGEKYLPIADDRAQAVVATCVVRGGIVEAVGPPVTGIKPLKKMCIGRRKNAAATPKKCPHNRQMMCSACTQQRHGIVAMKKAAATSDARRVSVYGTRLPNVIGSFILQALKDENYSDVSRFRTALILGEDPVTLAMVLKGNPMMRDAVAIATQGYENLAAFRALSQVVYALSHLLPKDQFAAFMTDGVITVPYKMVLAFPKGAELAQTGSENRMAISMVPISTPSPGPADPVILALPAAFEVLERLKNPAVRKRLIISFVYNGTGEPGVVRNLANFAPDRHSTPPRATVRVNSGPLTWAQINVMLDTFSTLIIEASYFNPAEAALFVVTGIMLKLAPENVCTTGMPVVHEALRTSPRMAHALEIFGKAQKRGVFSRVCEGAAMPSIIVTADGTANLTRAQRIHPLLRRIAAHLDPEVLPGSRPPAEQGGAERTTE